MPCRSLDQAALGQRLGRARVQRGLLVGRQQREAAPQLVARQRMHAQPIARLAGDEHRRVARQPRQPLAARPSAAATARTARDASRRGSRCASGRRHRPGSRLASSRSDERVAQRTAGCAGDRRHFRLRIAAGGHHRQRELQPQRPALGQFVQRRRRRRDRHASPKRARSELDGLVEAEAQLRRTDHGAAAVGHAGRRSRADGRHAPRPRRAGWTARCAAGRPAPPTWAPGRRSASSTISTMSSADLRHLGQPCRDTFEAGRRRPPRSGCGRRSAARRPRARPAPGSARNAARRPAAAPTATPPRCRAPDARAAIAPAARSCRAGRRLHQDDRLVAQVLVVGLQARASIWCRGTRGGVTLSNRSSATPARLRAGCGGHGTLRSRRRLPRHPRRW